MMATGYNVVTKFWENFLESIGQKSLKLADRHYSSQAEQFFRVFTRGTDAQFKRIVDERDARMMD